MTATRKASLELIERYQDLVRSIAVSVGRKVPRHIELDDLIAYGQIGLVEAAQDFDPKRGNAFSTYAYYRIRGAIYDGVSKLSWTSRSRYNRMRQQQQAHETANDAAGRPEGVASQPSPEPSTHRIDRAAHQRVMVYLATCATGDSELGAGGIADPTAPLPSDVAASEETSQKLRGLVDRLPTREATLIRAVYFDGKTLQVAGQELGISKSWASRLHTKALQQLARSLKLQGVNG